MAFPCFTVLRSFTSWYALFLLFFLRFSPISLHCSPIQSRSGELRTQKLKSHLVRPQSLHVLPLKPGIGQYISIPATLTARDFFLANFYLSGPFTYIFSKTSPNFSRVANTGSRVGPQNKIGHTLPDAGSRVECPWNINRLKKNPHDLWYYDL